jgi:hypothetical protein
MYHYDGDYASKAWCEAETTVSGPCGTLVARTLQSAHNSDGIFCHSTTHVYAKAILYQSSVSSASRAPGVGRRERPFGNESSPLIRIDATGYEWSLSNADSIMQFDGVVLRSVIITI